jgi:hypothetical protein
MPSLTPKILYFAFTPLAHHVLHSSTGKDACLLDGLDSTECLHVFQDDFAFMSEGSKVFLIVPNVVYILFRNQVNES